MRLLWNVIFVVGLLPLVSLSQDLNRGEASTSQVAQARSSVRGRAVYQGSGMPVRRGLIGLININDIGDDSTSKKASIIQDIRPDSFVLTDENGEFLIKNVEAGSYYPFVNVPNVVNPQSINSYFGRDSSASMAKLGEFFPKITVDGLNEAQVTVNVMRGATISGRVQYFDGYPVVGVKVRVIRKAILSNDDRFVSVRDVLTDDRGFYRFTELPPGDYYVSVTEPVDHKGENGEANIWNEFSGSELITYFPNVTGRKTADKIGVDWGQEKSEVNITLPDRRLFKMSGVIVAKDTREPIENIAVSFQRIDPEDDYGFFDGSDSNKVFTDIQGNWSFKDLPNGKYRIRVSQCRYYPCDKANSKNKRNYATSITEIEMDSDDKRDIRIELPTAAEVSGTVQIYGDKELPGGIYVSLIDFKSKLEESTSYYRNRNEDSASGKRTTWDFHIGMLPKGSYRFLARNDDDCCYVKSITLGSNDLTFSELEISEEQEIKDVKITLGTDVGRLSGRVSDEEGKPAVVTNLLLVPVEISKQEGLGFYFRGQTNSRGEFMITAAPGDYYVTYPTVSDNRFTEEDWLERATRDAVKVTIAPNKTTIVNLSKSKL